MIMKDKKELLALRHTTEHVLHTAMQNLYPKLKKAMGPATDNGFYFDFDLDEKISEADFVKIEKEMQKLINKNLPVEQEDISVTEAKKKFADNPYKLEWIDEIEEKKEKVSIYKMGEDDLDLCSGPHVDSTGEIKAFKLLSVAGAYWRGSEKNKMLTRIYATAFPTQKELDKYLEKLELAKKNDHRKIGKQLDLFCFSDLVGKGLVMYTPKGTIIKNELYKALMEACREFGAMEVNIPHMAKLELYKISGHADKFENELFTVQGHYKEKFILKPVNCPHHTQIYASRPRSYKDLPISYVESTQQHRDEKPGSIGGLNRTRSFEIDDGHTFCTEKQTKQEIINLISAAKKFYKQLGMWGNHWVSLSFRDKNTPEKYIGDDKGWETAQKTLLEIDKDLGLGGKVMEGEAALYGPKIDIMQKDALGNDIQLATFQVDFAMPKRFKLVYIDKNGQEKTPVMIHRAILGSYGRFIANLIETTGGAFPTWLSPIQVKILPVTERNEKYANKITKLLKDEGIRVEVDHRNETLQAKIRDASQEKVPHMLIVGDKEEKNKTVTPRSRNGKVGSPFTIDEFLDKIKAEIESKSIN